MIPLANHVWQSTLFGGLAALLALALRGNHAGTRHWIWLAASVKFLLPFSALVAVGMRLAPPAASAPAGRVMYLLDAGSAQMAAPAARLVPPGSFSPAVPLAALLLAVWAGGFAGIARRWWIGWRQMRAMVRDAKPVEMRLPIEARTSARMVEPGVFGILRPVLLLPEGIAEELTPEQLRAIVAHELCHVRRRDNLAAAVQMAVEAIFWFHPLVWWIGARLVEERERACDEEVLRQGNEPESYAEGILAACRLYLRSPLPCVSGVTGAELRGRIERIMTGCAARDLNAGKRLLVALGAVLAVGGPIAVGIATAPPIQGQTPQAGTFEVASVKPSPANVRGMNMVPSNGKLLFKNVPLDMIIAQAYQVYPYRLLNAPGWTHTARFDIEGKAANATATRGELFGMLQTLLAERFHMSAHREKRDMPVYSIVIGKGGPKLKKSENPEGWHGIDYRNGGTVLIGRNATMEELADALSFRMQRNVVDKTGLTNRFDFQLEFTPDEFVTRFGEDTPTPADANGTNIFTALQEQLGLKLDSGRGPVEMIVIDRVERPTGN